MKIPKPSNKIQIKRPLLVGLNQKFMVTVHKLSEVYSIKTNQNFK